MVLSYREALKVIEKGKSMISPVYLLSGEEEYLQEKLIEKIKATWLSEILPEFNFNREDGSKLTSAQVVDMANQYPFMAPCRMILVENPAFIPISSKNNKKSASAQNEVEQTTKKVESGIIEYLERPAETTCLVFWCRQGKPDKRNKLVKLIDKLGGLVEIPFLKPAEALREMNYIVQATGRRFGPQALEHLVHFSRPDMRNLVSELEKIITFSETDRTIDLRMVQTIMTPSLEADIFKMVDSMGQKQCALAIKQLRGLMTRGEPAIKILNMMIRQFSLIFKAKIYLDKGYSKQEIGQAMDCHPFIAGKAINQSKNFSFVDLERIMEELLEKDLALKSGANMGQALETFILSII